MVILLSFANNKTDHLPLLKEESSEIRQALMPLEKRDFIKIRYEESLEQKELLAFLLNNMDDISIFHYGGHADSDELLLEDGMAQDKGLAGLLAQQKNLKLVFLNGCSTRGQVDTLFAAGVKAVIATSVPIHDAMAKDFAIAFYQALVYKNSLKRAFEFAKSAVETRYRDAPAIEFHRGIGHAVTPSVKEEKLPWGLYVKEEFENEIFNFKLPYYKEVSVNDDILVNVSTNRYIVEVLREMCNYKKDIYTQMTVVRDGEEVKRDSSYFLKIVMDNFPLVMGKQIALLKQLQIPDAQRLEQIISTYIITGQTLYYILLSNFWEEKSKTRQDSPPDFLKRNTITIENSLKFDYYKAIWEILELMKKSNFPLFIPELETFCQNLSTEGSDTNEAHKMLEILRGSYTGITGAEVVGTCKNAEMALASIFWDAAFLVNYEIFSVRDIEINFPRASAISYELEWGAADENTLLFNDETSRRKQQYTNCDSIVMVGYGRDGDLKNYLNLTPFFIDKNTFHKVVRDDNVVQKNNIIDLFMFRYEKEGVYYYTSIRHNYFLPYQNEKGTDIVHTQMTMRDFEVGANITNQTPKMEFKSSKFAKIEAEEKSKSNGNDKPIFADLENQFMSFKTSFT